MGITGYEKSTVERNAWPEYRDRNIFFAVFAVYFPAATGVLCGANRSGELINPAVSIPKGTIAAVFGAAASYAFVAMILGSVVKPRSDRPP